MSWYPYTDWEDFQAGMYHGTADEREIEQAQGLLENLDGLRDAMNDVVLAWRRSASQHLSQQRNARAWLGQAACCYAVGARQFATCLAWWRLTEDQQEDADAVADQVIDRWKRERERGEYAQTLLGL